jgi:Na+-translocating ferredoxin:NAD+ oxidoreductase subunit G
VRTTPLHVMTPTKPPRPRGETLRIVLSMTVACLVGAAVLGLVYLGTDRYRVAAAARDEDRTLHEMLQLGPGARLLEVRQYLAPARQVVYRAAPLAARGGSGREVAFTLDGALAREGELALPDVVPKTWRPLGRMFVATRPLRPGEQAPADSGAAGPGMALAGFVAQGETRGYKAPIVLFVAMTPDFGIVDMRVVKIEDDPGLGADVAQDWFREQYVGRTAEEIARLDVTRDPMPEDWKEALVALARRAPDGPARHRELLGRERRHPIYAVTGATISSRAVTEGVRRTVDHFRRRWWLLAPHLGAAAGEGAS